NGNPHTVSIEANTANLRIKTPIPLGDFLGARCGVPVQLDNDANAAAVGEMVYGGAKGMRHFIMLTLGTGVGSGIVIDGKLLHGAHGMAGELGHAIVVPGGRPCSCGRQGCVEMYASARGICQNYREALLNKHPGKTVPEDLSCKYVGESALQGDPVAVEAYDTTARWLGVALANAAAFSEPEAIFLMGGPTRAGEALMRPLRRYFEENLLFLYKGTIKILLSQLAQNDVAILGAAALGIAE
ncbi:MAG: ROK family protein, partial [Bacteroidales bacterium]|nr:ROK family protein [Bacteroidales bacterium]